METKKQTTTKSVEEYQTAWLNHLNDFTVLGWKMTTPEHQKQFKKAIESMAKIVGIATATYQQGLEGGSK